MKIRVTWELNGHSYKLRNISGTTCNKNVQNIVRHMQNVKYVVYFQKTVEELHQIPIQSQWLDLVKMPQSILGNN